MFNLNENYEVYGNILKSDCIQYSPSEISTINTANSQKNISVYLEKILFFPC